MFEIVTEQLIKAKVESVWSNLIDFAAYPSWNPFLKKIEGELKLNAKLKVVIQAPADKNEMVFKPLVTQLVPGKEFRWVGKLAGIAGLFTGEHYFHIEEQGEFTLLVHGERFTGILVPLLRKQLDTATRQGFINMNDALADRCSQNVELVNPNSADES